MLVFFLFFPSTCAKPVGLHSVLVHAARSMRLREKVGREEVEKGIEWGPLGCYSRVRFWKLVTLIAPALVNMIAILQLVVLRV